MILGRYMMLGRSLLLAWWLILPATDDAVANNDNAGVDVDADDAVGAEREEVPAAGGADSPRAAAAAMRDDLMAQWRRWLCLRWIEKPTEPTAGNGVGASSL